MDTEKIKSRGKKLKIILDSATFALLLSIVLFSYEMISSTKETDAIVDNLMEIQGSLSTRYLGLFPEYIDNINNLLNNTIEEQGKSEIRDSVIIFEDVLYYGIRSDAEGFRKMIENLVTLTNSGCHITIAFYAADGMPFKQMIRDKLIEHEYKKQFREDMNSYLERVHLLRRESGMLDRELPRAELDEKLKESVNKHFNNYLADNPHRADSLHQVVRNIYSYRLVDSILNQQYYEKTCNANHKRMETMVKGLLQPLPQKENAVDATTLRVNQLCSELDKIKQQYMDKPYHNVTYSDFYNMYKDISLAICSLLKQQPNIELLPLNESLMMCCWMSSVNGKEQAIFAFPSKYSTDEIGFISQDVAIARYIRTMLKGVRESHTNMQ
ncbi:MAG: hypothetical protein E7130_02035 [Rikenellaceae bacterium]|nr:hypothetical protein [Rikenellaceae bacterium]